MHPGRSRRIYCLMPLSRFPDLNTHPLLCRITWLVNPILDSFIGTLMCRRQTQELTAATQTHDTPFMIPGSNRSVWSGIRGLKVHIISACLSLIQEIIICCTVTVIQTHTRLNNLHTRLKPNKHFHRLIDHLSDILQFLSWFWEILPLSMEDLCWGRLGAAPQFGWSNTSFVISKSLHLLCNILLSVGLLRELRWLFPDRRDPCLKHWSLGCGLLFKTESRIWNVTMGSGESRQTGRRINQCWKLVYKRAKSRIFNKPPAAPIGSWLGLGIAYRAILSYTQTSKFQITSLINHEMLNSDLNSDAQRNSSLL